MQTDSQSIDQTSKVLSQPPRLPHPLRITEQVWPEGTVPVVTIKCNTYNHVNFIRDAIEGFLMQETTFPVEILIHDDASTDGTADIVREYQAMYPQLIRTVLQTENQYSQGKRPMRFLNHLIRGEFIALCEGDDYWTIPKKLQKQVDLIEGNPECPGVAHWAEDQIDGELRCAPPPASLRDWPRPLITAQDLIRQNVITTCSIMFRWSMRPAMPSRVEKLPMGDWPLWIGLALHGGLACIRERMAVYRVHKAGAWSGMHPKKQLTASAQMIVFLWDDLPEGLRPVAVKSFGKFARLALHHCSVSQDDLDFAACVRRLRSELAAAGLPSDLPPALDQELAKILDEVVFAVISDKANKAWDSGAYARARDLYKQLASRPGVSWVVRIKAVLASAGPNGRAAKRVLAKVFRTPW